MGKGIKSLVVQHLPLKKVLSLVLCVAVMLSVMVLGAGAAFSDQDKIENTEAVNMCSALNIIGGYEDGSFHPERNIKRSEVTKMICVALNGGKDPNVSTNAVPTFSDVRGTSAAWAEGYIESCVAQGIVSGVGGGRFAPDGNLTAAQLAKMLLVALGYNAENEKFVGDTWETNVNVRASQKGLYKGLATMDTSAAVTRDAAAQMVWNALQANMVEYKTTIVTDENGQLTTQITVQDRVVENQDDKLTLLRDKYDGVVETGFITKAPNSKTNPKGITFYYDDDDNGIPEQPVNFKNATQDVSDLFGYEVKVVWNSNEKDSADAIYGIYKTANNTDYVMTWDDVEQDAKNNNKIKFDGSTYELDLNDTVADAVDGYVDLKQYSNHSADVADDKTVIAAYADGDKLGVDASVFTKAALADTVTFIDNDGDGKIEAVQIKETDVAKISYVSNSSLTSTLVGSARSYAPTYTNSPKLADVNTYEGMAKDDYAKVTYDYHNDKLTYEKLELQTGKIEATRTDATGTKEIRIDGNWYKASADYTTMPTGLYTNDTVEFVAIDNLLYHVKKTDGAYGSKSLALIYDAANYNVGVNQGKVQVSMITRDGETMDVFVDKDYGWNGSAVANAAAVTKNAIVTYRVVDGEYRFAEIGAGNLAGFDHADAADAAYVGSSDKFDGKDISDNAVVFVYDDNTVNPANTPKVMSGKTFMDNAGNSNSYYANYLYNDNNGFDEVMVMAVGYNTIPTVVGSTYGVLTADAYETELDKDGYRYFNMYISGLGDVVAREKNGDTYTYTAGTVMKYELVSTEEDGTVTIKNVASVTPSTGMVTSDGVFDTKYIGLDNTKYELDADTVYLDMDTQNNKGVAYGDEVKAKLTKADVANNTANVRYVVAGGKVKFIMIDSERNEIVLGTTIESPSKDTLNKILANAQSGETITIEGTVPAGSFTNKSGVTLELADGAVITGATDLETNNSGTIKINGIVDLADNSTLTIPDAISMPAGAGFDIAKGGTLDWEDAKFGALQGKDVAFSVRCVDGNTDNLDTVIKESVTLGAGTLGSSDGGSLTIPAGVKITVASGSALKLGGNVTVEGAIDVQSGGEIRFRDDGKIAFIAGSDLDIDGGATKVIVNGTQVKVASGTNANDIITAIGGMTITAGDAFYETSDSGSTWTVVS